MTEIIPIKSAYEIIKDVLGKGYDALGFIFPDIPSSINARRTENLIRIMKQTQEKLDKAGISPEDRATIALRLGIPIMEKSSLEDDPSLQDLWSNLLANALNPNNSNKVQAIFVDLIQKISSFDALVLNSFYLSPEKAVMISANDVIVFTKNGYEHVSKNDVEISLNVLLSLNLLSDTEESNNIAFNNQGVFLKSSPHITPLGRLFVEACIKDATD